VKKWLIALALLSVLAAAGCAQTAPASSAASSVSSAAASGEVASSASSSVSSSASSSGAGAASAQASVPELETLLEDIASADPGSAGSSLKAARAAGELLDWAQEGNTAQTAAVTAWLDARQPDDAPGAAAAYAAVLDAADAVLQGGGTMDGTLKDAGYSLGHSSYDPARYHAAAKSLSPFFTRALEKAGAPGWTEETPGDYAAITLDALDGLWCDSSAGEMLIFSGETCRVVIPYLDELGDTAYAARIRDRSQAGFCPALEIDIHGAGDFSGPLTYYVSGIDGSHFWCNTQAQRFAKLPQNF